MYIGLDIGGTNIKGILTNPSGTILAQAKIQTGTSKAEIEKNIDSITHTLAQKAKLSMKSLKAIGIGIAGAVDSNKGIVLQSPNIPALNKYPLADKIRKKTGIPTFIENDANVALLGEFWLGNGKKYRNWLMLTLGTGVGGGAIVEGRMLTGRNGFAAEFGHITIDRNGAKCGCGSIGCLEAYASASSMARRAKAELKDNSSSSLARRSKTEELTAQMIFEEAKNGDEFALKVMHETGRFLGIGVASLINVFNPEAVIFAGGLSRGFELLKDGIQAEVTLRVMKPLRDKVKYHVVKHEDRGPAYGAIKNAIDRLKKK